MHKRYIPHDFSRKYRRSVELLNSSSVWLNIRFIETATTRLTEADDPITAGPSGSYPDEALWNYCIAYHN